MTILSATIAKFLLLAKLATSSFAFVQLQNRGNEFTCATTTNLFAEVAEKKSLTAAEILARARKSAGVPEDEPPLKIFDDDLLDDMQQLLLLLEKRVKEGPGSLSLLDVEQIQALSGNVLTEMKEKESSRLSGSTSVTPAPAADAEVEVIKSQSPVASAPSAPAVEIVKSKEIVDTSDDEGPEYDGTGGMGLAKGTANTYVIPGMDSMSPEEYQKALQQSIIDRQRNRKASGKYGNRATWDYLNNLTGETGVLRKE